MPGAEKGGERAEVGVTHFEEGGKGHRQGMPRVVKARQGQETDSPLKSPEEHSAANTLIFHP